MKTKPRPKSFRATRLASVLASASFSVASMAGDKATHSGVEADAQPSKEQALLFNLRRK